VSGPRRTPAGGIWQKSALPPHISGWQLPPDWKWGSDGLLGDQRHYQEIIDGLGRSLALVTAPNPDHEAWLHSEAQHLAHRSHPAIPTTYHYWKRQPELGRGPGYLRRWITGESVRAHLSRIGTAEIPYILQVLRGAGSALSYLHDSGTTHGALSADTVWVTPTRRLWMLEWQWAIPRSDIPLGMRPTPERTLTDDGRTTSPTPPEWVGGDWAPTPASDQWQLAAMCFEALTGEDPPSVDIPPVRLLRPECPASVATAIDRALLENAEERFHSVSAFLRVADRGYASRSTFVLGERGAGAATTEHTHESRVRWALGDDYEVLSDLGSGSFGRVWRARDLSLEREVALKVLHPHIAVDGRAVGAFWREAKLAAQLAHPSIVPIYDWDSRGDLSWYTMELAEEGSVASLISRSGPRSLSEIAEPIEMVLEGLSAAHAAGIVHRDLKPENILIDRYRRWRITDFGIANVTGEEVAGTTGTPAFAAPEQLLGEPQGPAADLFAVAGIVVFALSGAPPFGDGEPQEILARQLSRRVDLSSYPAAVGDWLRTALSPNPDERFTGAGAMKDAWARAVRTALRRERSGWWWRSVAE
jgi:eukaryotic-like serine/threonine-protein kinase